LSPNIDINLEVMNLKQDMEKVGITWALLILSIPPCLLKRESALSIFVFVCTICPSKDPFLLLPTKLEAFWLNLEGFEEALAEAWVCDPSIADPFRRLDALFRNAAEFFQSWGERKVGNIKLKIAMANTLILRFDVAQEARRLTQAEAWLRRTLKHVVLGLASLERTIARQRSRIRWLREGDANTKLFHAVANGRGTKNYIASVRVGEEMVTTQERKNEVFTEAFDRLIWSIQNREHTKP
jgi:hypothetical protein